MHYTYGERPNIPRKPDPTSVLQLLDELGGDKETTLYIGDSATDMQTAVNAGLTAIGVAWDFARRRSCVHPVRTRLRMSRAICCRCSSMACPM